MTLQEAPPLVTGRYVGKRERKHRGDRFLTGRGCYIDDVEVPNAVFMSVVRSEHAHARIRGVDLSAVRADPRCVVALDGEEGLALADPMPHYFSAGVFGGQHNDVRILAVGKVTYVGQPVAAVVAATRSDADALAALVAVDYEPLTPVLDARKALEPGSPLVYDDWNDNMVLSIGFPHGDFAAAAAAADHVIEEEFSIGRYSSQPIEPRGYVAKWDARSERMTFWGSSQNPHPMRWVLAGALRLEEDQVHVIAPDIGGGFGLKMHGHPEEPLICVMSRLIAKPVKWIEDRSESLLIGARQHDHRYAIAFNDDGDITGFRDHLVANIGAVTAVPGWGMAMLTGLVFPTGYEIPNTDVHVSIVTTNFGPWSPTRGYGKEGTNLIMERAIELVAERLRMDPAEVRRRNLLRPEQLPYRTNGGLNLDSGDYPEGLERALELGGYAGFAERRTLAAAEGRTLGFGIAFELTPEAADIPNSLASGFDSCTVRMNPSGRVQILTGVTTPGGGNDTGISQIVADELGVELDMIRITQGDTDLCPYGFGNSSGRSTVVGVGASLLAAREVSAKVRKAAGILLEAEPDEIVLHQGVARVADTDREMPIKDVAWSVYGNAFAEMAGVEAPLEATKAYQPDNIDHRPDDQGRIQPYPTYSYAVHVAEVEVDVETGCTNVLRFGVLHDCGTMINPLFVEGQMHGAATMGIGAALSEVQRFDDEGRLINNRFKTYMMPRASDVPSFAMAHMVTPSPYTMLGVKGAGEAGVGGAQAAVVNAINDAIRPLGAAVRRTPADPPTVLRAIQEAAGADTVRAFVTVGARQVHFRRAGHGPALVLLHESPLSSASLTELIAALATRFTVVALDTPGYGSSDLLADPAPAMAEYADAVAETLDALGIARCNVYGAHTGAHIALTLADRHPERVGLAVLDGILVIDEAWRANVLANYLLPFPPAIDGSHLATLWTRFRDQHLFNPWFEKDLRRRMDFTMVEPQVLHDGVLDFLRAGAAYDRGYIAAFSHRPEPLLARARTRIVVVAREDDLLADDLGRLGTLPDAVSTELLGRDRDAWAARIGDLLAEVPVPEPPPSPAVLPLPAGRATRRYADTSLGQLLVRQAGAGDGRPILLLHAAPGSAVPLVPLALALAESRPVIALDMLGHGESDPPPWSRAEMADYVPVVAEALEACGIDGPVDVYGSHGGAVLAMELATRRPALVHRLVLDGVPDFDDALRDRLLAHRTPDFPLRDDGTHLLAAWHFVRNATLFFPWFDPSRASIRWIDPAPVETVHATFVEVAKSIGTYGIFYRAALAAPTAELSRGLGAPTLFVAKRSDAIFDDTVRLASRTDGAAFLEAPADPHALAAMLAPFLADPEIQHAD